MKATRLRLGSRVLFAAACSVFGCGGEPVDGLYKVESVVMDSQGCGPGTAVAGPLGYLRVKVSDLLGLRYYNFASCSAADTATCDGIFGLPIYTIESSGGSGYLASGTGSSSCTMQYVEGAFTVTGGSLRHELRTYRQSNVTGVPCDQNEAQRRGRTLPCISSQLVTGTRVSP